ncbi:hypothetical protein EB118_17020, partial [bacterium]|nr:hypothetical protein [bacterium]
MAIVYINTGSGANAGDGDNLRTAFNKVNSNFQFLSTNSVTTSTPYYNIIPATNNTFNIGSSSTQWANILVKNQISLNSSTLSVSTSGYFKFQNEIVGRIFTSDTPPLGAETGLLWFDSSFGKLYIY